jgi:2,4'-dihydroxyacetophenone dioxygenase
MGLSLRLLVLMAAAGSMLRSAGAFSTRVALAPLSSSISSKTQSSISMKLFQSTTTTTRTKDSSTDVSKSDDYTPYQGDQPKDALSEIFVPQVFSHSLPNGEQLDDERLWVPQTESVSFRPLCFCVSNGYYVNLLRVRGSGLLSRHRHPGPVHGHVLKGRWRYLEHDWEATAGSYVFEPPGEIHTLVVPDGVDEMITLFHVTGSLLYCDPDGKVTGAEDVFSKLELAKKHYAEVGLGEDFVQQFVR